MPEVLSPIPINTPIVAKDGTITTFFRLRWQELIQAFSITNDVANIQETGQNASVGATNAWVALAAGLYRVSWYLREMTADGTSSSLQVTINWEDHGTPLSISGPALTSDAVTANQSGSGVIYVDQSSAIQFSIAYASHTAGKMVYNYAIVVENLP